MEGYEICPSTFALLKSNVDRLCRDRKMWTLVQGCGASKTPDRETDLVYLDPNWGGSEYKREAEVQLVLGKQCVTEIILRWLREGLKICLKAPVNWHGYKLVEKDRRIRIRKYPVLNGDRISYYLYFFSTRAN